MGRTTLVTLASLALAGLGLAGLTDMARAQDGLTPPAPQKVRSLVFTAPAGWDVLEPDEPERAAWRAPAPEKGAGGPAARLRVAATRLARRPLDEHVARWAKAWEDGAGKPLAPTAVERKKLEAEGVESATLVVLRGSYTGATEPGAEERVRRDGWLALHAVLEGPDGPWVVVVRGPAAQVEALKPAFLELVKATRPGLVEAPPPPTEPPPPEPEGEDR